MISDKSKTPYLNKSKEEELMEDEKIDRILKDITLKRPHSAYAIFLSNEIESIKAKNKDQKIVLKEINPIIIEKWHNLKEEEKKKYEKLYDEENYRYKAGIELVSHYIFKDSNFNSLNIVPTAYRIYLNEKLREGFEQGLDPKEVKKEASLSWAEMPKEKKQIYIDKKRENDNWFAKAQNIKKISPTTLFVQEQIEKAETKGIEPPLVKDLLESWNTLSDDVKKRFEKYAQELNEEKEKLRDLYDILYGLKPKKPKGAFKVFVREQAKNNKFKNFQDSSDLWNKLSEEEKEKYLMKSHRLQLAYKYKKMIYKKKIKKILPRKPLIANLIFLKEKKGHKPPNGEGFIKYWQSIYENLPPEKKKKYEEMAKKDRENYEKKISQFKNKIFDMPKNPISPFSMYLIDRIPDLKKQKPKEHMKNFIKQVAEEWQKGEIVDIQFYHKKSELDRIRFKKQLKEFNKFGYYTRPNVNNNEENNDFDEENEKNKKQIKKKRTSIIRNKKTKRGGKSTKKIKVLIEVNSLSEILKLQNNKKIQIIDK